MAASVLAPECRRIVSVLEPEAGRAVFTALAVPAG
jgi:hypothetical protein